MMYRYLTLNDGTEVVHSDVLPDGRVKVFFERPDCRRYDDFDLMR